VETCKEDKTVTVDSTPSMTLLCLCNTRIAVHEYTCTSEYATCVLSVFVLGVK